MPHFFFLPIVLAKISPVMLNRNSEKNVFALFTPLGLLAAPEALLHPPWGRL